MTSRHEFLAELHALLKPRTYLEIGVQYGWSLDIAHAAEVAIGIDPAPLVQAKGNQIIHQMTSDDAFAGAGAPVLPPIDLAFIDGMHLFEYALRDFMNVLRLTHDGSMIVFDDVLPRNQEEANRVQCPGDWTGDVWKIYGVLRTFRIDLRLRLIDTQPTGLLLVSKNESVPLNEARESRLDRIYESLVKSWSRDMPVPDDVLTRQHAWQPEAALEEIRKRMEPAT